MPSPIQDQQKQMALWANENARARQRKHKEKMRNAQEKGIENETNEKEASGFKLNEAGTAPRHDCTVSRHGCGFHTKRRHTAECGRKVRVRESMSS